MNYVILDLEATCWDQWDKKENETIEIGAVLVDENQQILSEFQRFIKPIRYPKLSEFCKELTTITQEEVDNANYFYEVIEEFKAWFDEKSNNYLLCSWGFYDRRQFEDDCKLHNLDTSWLHRHISLKHQYGKIKKLRRNVGMKSALKIEGIELEGTHHRGIDDARNITKIFLNNFSAWKTS